MYISLSISLRSYEQHKDKGHAFFITKSQDTHAIDRAATRIGTTAILPMKNSSDYGGRMQYSNSMHYQQIW
jgi:hypothetical protein